MSNVTREQLDAGRDAAIAAVMAARDLWLVAAFAKLQATAREQLGGDTIEALDQLAHAKQKLADAAEHWDAEAGGDVLRAVELANGGDRELVEASGATFPTAWEVARHCARVALRDTEGAEDRAGPLDTAEGVRYLDWCAKEQSSAWGWPDHDAIRGRIINEHAAAVRELHNSTQQPPDPPDSSKTQQSRRVPKDQAHERIKNYIAEQLQAGELADSPNLKRDAIARECQVSSGQVSNSPAWKQLASERRGAIHPPDPLEDAMQRQDWERVEQIQQQEHNRRQGR